MDKKPLRVGQVVQLNPERVLNPAFAGCFMIVTDPKPFGAQGYIQGIGDSRRQTGGQAYYRAKYVEMEEIGDAVWMVT